MAPPKHRQCGVQQVTERLYELDPNLRGRHQRIEDECRRSIAKGEAQRVWRKLITIQVVVHVVAKTDEENISDEQIESQIEVLNQDYRGNERRTASKRPDSVAEPRRRPEHPVRARHEGPEGQAHQRHHARADHARLLRHRRLGQDEGRAAARRRGPTDRYLNIWVCNLGERAARLRAVPRRAGEDRRRRDPLHRVRHQGRRRRPLQPRPHGHPRGRPLAQPAPHLGRHQRLLGLRPGLRHPARPGAQLRQARLARTSPATTAPTATCSWTTWTTSTTPRCSCSPRARPRA